MPRLPRRRKSAFVAHINSFHIYPDRFTVVEWTDERGVRSSTSGSYANPHMQALVKRARREQRARRKR